MSLKDQMAADALALMNTGEFAEYIRYNDVRIIAIFEQGEEKKAGHSYGSEGMSDRAFLHVLASDVAAPTASDTFKREDDTTETEWRVSRVLESVGGMHRLECATNVSPFRR